MRHRMDGKKLNRTTSHRRALRRNMAAALIHHGAIRTTEAKAKMLRRFVEKLITTAKKNTLHARRRVIADLCDRELFDDDGNREEKRLVAKLFDEVAPRYVDRPGGYTRIIRLAERRIGDAGKQVLLQLVEEESVEAGGSAGSSRRKKRAALRCEAAAAFETAGTQVAEAEVADEPVEAEAADAPAEDAPADEAADDAAEGDDEAK